MPRKRSIEEPNEKAPREEWIRYYILHSIAECLRLNNLQTKDLVELTGWGKQKIDSWFMRDPKHRRDISAIDLATLNYLLTKHGYLSTGEHGRIVNYARAFEHGDNLTGFEKQLKARLDAQPAQSPDTSD